MMHAFVNGVVVQKTRSQPNVNERLALSFVPARLADRDRETTSRSQCGRLQLNCGENYLDG